MIDFGSAQAGAIAGPENRGTGLRIFACHFITPIDDNVCIDHWLHVRNFAPGDADVDQRLHADFRIAFNEDKEILERIEEVAQARPNAKCIRLAIDAAPQRMRRIVERMAAGEGETRASAYPPFRGARSASPESIVTRVMPLDGFRACALQRIPE